MTISREETQRKLNIQAAAAATHTPNQTYTVADRYEEQARRFPDKAFLIYEDKPVTFGQLDLEANRVANAAAKLGLRQGDVAALMMDNRPEFFFVYVGLAKLGVTTALINTHAQDKALRHALSTTASRMVFLGAECLQGFASAADVTGDLPCYVIADPLNQVDIPEAMVDFSTLAESSPTIDPPKESRSRLMGRDDLFYVFTSGTTGLPKAAHMSHMRWMNTGESNAAVLDTGPDDVFYCFLPLYHGAAGMSLVSAALARGATIVLRRRFSVSRFWEDVRRHGVTTCQYIGEICRYLMNRPPQINDADNPLRSIIGAGLRSDIWEAFQQRFGIENIYEGWGATEANSGIMNLDNKVGSCGRIPFKERSNARLVRYDAETDSHPRDANGHYIECEADEVGELIAMILDIPGSGAGRFEGYTDEQATEKKILHDVFADGDAWFRSGDLLKRDEDDYYYFVDRVGDTFRWKSENVSASEAADAISDFDGLESLNIYGVAVPNTEGRAGMAALVMQSEAEFDPVAFYAHCKDRLPPYAVPLFVRLCQQAELTTTFKLRKVDLQKQGYSPELVSDPLYVISDANQRYVPLDEQSLAEQQLPAFISA
jgi:fatty-acyl-CoA synthase